MNKYLLLTVTLFMLSITSLLAQQSGNYVIVRLFPSNAQIEIDSINCPTKDGVAQCLLPMGKHSFRVFAPDFKTKEGTFEISPSTRTELSVKLDSYQAYLSIQSQARDAEVTLDGEKISGGVWKGYITPGSHILRATKKEYQPFEQVINASEGGNLSIVIPELRKSKGSINIAIMPVDAEVYIDNVYKGLSPLVLNNLDVGEYKVEVKKLNFDSMLLTVRVKEGQQTNLTGNLVAYEGVDLGLSVLWATFNVGTTDPTGQGMKVCWGATSESWDESPEINGYDFIGQAHVYKQYCSNELTWGGSWRMPTRAECKELMSLCKWEYTFIDNVKVARIVGPNGNSIIMPFGSYWTCERNPKWSSTNLSAYDLSIYGDDEGVVRCGDSYGELYYNDRFNYHCSFVKDDEGRSINAKLMIRPVMSKPKDK